MKKTLVGLLLLLTAVLCAWPSINLGGGLRTVGGGAPLTLYDNDNQNIHASYDPLANPATVDAEGIVMAIGFEDGMYTPGVGDTPYSGASSNQCNDTGSAANPMTTLPVGCTCRGGCAYSNYWYDQRNWASLAQGGAPVSAIHRLDPQGKHWTRCRTDDTCGNGSGSECADFGAAGTNCTATMSWYQEGLGGQSGRVHATHPVFTADGSPNTNHPTKGFTHFYLRWYQKVAGVTSDECPAGYPNCPVAQYNYGESGQTGVMGKGIEFGPSQGFSGIWMLNLAVSSDGAIIPGRSTCTEGNYEVPAQGVNSNQFFPANVASPVWPIRETGANSDQWVFNEIYIKMEDNFAASNGVYKHWADFCGRDGRGCTGTPTLRASYTGLRIYPYNCPNAPNLLDHIWMNFFTNVPIHEVQFDEIMVRDADVKNEQIRFAPVIN